MKDYVITYYNLATRIFRVHDNGFIESIASDQINDDFIELSLYVNYPGIDDSYIYIINKLNNNQNRLIVEIRDVPKEYYTFGDIGYCYDQIVSELKARYSFETSFSYIHDFGYATHHVMMFPDIESMKKAEVIALLNNDKIIAK